MGSVPWAETGRVILTPLTTPASKQARDTSRPPTTIDPVTMTALNISNNRAKEHIQEVLDKWTQIDDEIWAKVIVFERNRRVAKAYARAPVLTINGSDDGFDGMRLRLGVTYEKGVTLGNVTMSHRTRESPPNALRLSTQL
ncbi:hypothetical protein EVAR_45348_1 [Eumeta japonica]|uniref:MH2 domain-containing protein n=1 Tax=Eumeta variegata TaxID=151549 RepID=A0A4C1XY39_EUMVA|nr:hypothetical protein EVAR_45348_1 [Eumeta japonica]